MKNWKITGIIATLVIVFSIPAYVLKQKYYRQSAAAPAPVSFVGGQKCAECHKNEYDKWRGSHHDLAMDEANDSTVLGNFEDAVFEYFGAVSRFYRKDSRFLVNTQGPGGQMGDFEIKYTFGVYPLQQYLVPFPGGRLQCLPIAWDAKNKKWYHLAPDAPADPADWLYWTNAGQNWNGMCAECHSTNLKKNYDLASDSYRTTWSEIDVSCEACHGPGSNHVKWAELPDMARPVAENYRLVAKTSGINSRKLVELCAPCHARRAILGDYTHAEPDLMDTMLPSLLNEELYFSDGQILAEVYVYGSFTQSKMYARDVRCSDCHDVHSIKTVKTGNALCLQCHRADVYDTGDHHFHKKNGEPGQPLKTEDGQVLFDVGTGSECAQCHMPGRIYMGNDYRPDHSFRIPRPDLSLKLDVPNACNRCHLNKSFQWADAFITKWYGPGRRGHYGTIIDAGRKHLPDAPKMLTNLAGDPLYPVIVRATALSLLGTGPIPGSDQTYELALADEEALIRRTAVDRLNAADLKKQTTLLAAMLYDPVKAVRIEAARRLTEIDEPQLDGSQQKRYQAALQEYQDSMEYSADFAFARYNLGNLYTNLRQPEKAVENFLGAIRIDNQFFPAKVNLAMLYNQMGRKGEAEALLREVVIDRPAQYDVRYSLGLLLAENKKYAEAAGHLLIAAKGLPGRGRVHYNLGFLLQQLKRDVEAEAALLAALEIEPDSLDYLYAAADHYLKRGKLVKAGNIAEQMIEKHPRNSIGRDILNYINERQAQHNKP
ncbi:probable deca-heme c-type cytochrome [Olavius sp. associated proteobacterium Delta 1]|nr:probable deca-heme c-type cytochrome [Olavius sp. associated proteobacterium Delta 1]